MSRTGLIVMAYGTPRSPADVEAYYTDIRRGRPPTAEQLADLQRRYDAIGGISPLAERTEAQRAALAAALDRRRPGEFEVVLGQKHAAPFIEDAVRRLADEGIDRAVGLVLAPHYSAASVGEYQARAMAAGAEAGVEVLPIDSWHLEPAYLDFLTAALDRGPGHAAARPQGALHRPLPARAGPGRRPLSRPAPRERGPGGRTRRHAAVAGVGHRLAERGPHSRALARSRTSCR